MSRLPEYQLSLPPVLGSLCVQSVSGLNSSFWLQARHCYTRYNEYHRCVAQKGEGAEECRVFQRAYRSLCPGEWLERWNEQREEGTWPGRY